MFEESLREKLAHVTALQSSILIEARNAKNTLDTELDATAQKFPACTDSINQIKLFLQETFSLTEQMLTHAVPFNKNLAVLRFQLSQLQNFCRQIDAYLNQGETFQSELNLYCNEFADNLDNGLQELAIQKTTLVDKESSGLRNRSNSDSMLPTNQRPSLGKNQLSTLS